MASFEDAPPLTFESSYDGLKSTKKGRPKGLSVNDLLPLHKDVGVSTKQLVEPATPDFKPTPEWVRDTDMKLLFLVCCTCMSQGSLGSPWRNWKMEDDPGSGD